MPVPRRRKWYCARRKQRPILPIDFGDLYRRTPFSRAFSYERGRPVDRYYIERFLEEHAADVRGRVLEVGENLYTGLFGGERVVQSDVLNLTAENPNATIVADLTQAESIPAGAFDCFIFTQTLQFIYDVHTAIATIHHILKPQGVLLASFPVLSQICRYDMDRWGDYWRFTSASVQRLLEEHFTPDQIQVTAHGNILAAVSFLHGLAVEDLSPDDLDINDPDYQVVITARAVK